MALSLTGSAIHPEWSAALAGAEEQLLAVGAFLADEEQAGATVLPDRANILRALRRPLSGVRVLIVGQDPYPTPGHPIGLSFATERHVRPIPRSLTNIYKELRDDLGIPMAPHGDLSAWSDQGVLLLNRVLTVRAGTAGSHRGHGWEQITELAIRRLVERGGPLVAILWGRDAHNLRPLLGEVPILESAHPSPLSASSGFFGSRPFGRANELLEQQGAAPIDWRVDPPAADASTGASTGARAGTEADPSGPSH